MISVKLPWSKNPLCQELFRAVGRRMADLAEGWRGPGSAWWAHAAAGFDHVVLCPFC